MAAGAITLTITSNPVVNSDSPTIAYTKGANPVTDTHRNELATFSATAVTNNVPAGSTYDPVTELGAKLLNWWDFTDTATMFTDTGGTTAVASDNDAIVRVDDKGTRGNNLVNASSSNDWDATNGQVDCIGDANTYYGLASYEIGADVDVYFAIKSNSAGPYRLFGRSLSQYGFGVQDVSAVAIMVGSNWTGATVYVDDVVVSPSTRDGAHTAIADGSGHVFHAAGISKTKTFDHTLLDNTNRNGADAFDGAITHILVVNGATITAQEHNDLMTWLLAEVPV